MTDGLSQLAARGRRTRDIPPPRNPARTAPVQLTSVPGLTAEEEPAAAPAPAVEAPAAKQTEPARPAARRDPKPAPDAVPMQKAKAELTLSAALQHTGHVDLLDPRPILMAGAE